MIRFSEDDLEFIYSALILAADKYDEYVADLSDVPGNESVTRAFKDQAAKAREIATRIEERA